MLNTAKTILFYLQMLLIILPIYLTAQAQDRSGISGWVLDSSTGKPLYLADVFLANTTRGCAADKNGHYFIRNIPPGTYELVVSMMGYESLKKTIELSKIEDMVVNFSLKPKILEGEEVVVTAEDAKEWRKNLKIFERVFFGMKEFAKECKFLNPEVLDFEYERNSGQFRATAEAPLRMQNKALGYEIVLLLRLFTAQIYNGHIFDYHSYGSQRVLRIGTKNYLATARFRELKPANRNAIQKWAKNRVVAYNGSQRHFFKSLCENRLKEEGFEIWAVENFGTAREYDSRIDIDTILQPARNPDYRFLSFKNYLKVMYKKEEDDINKRIIMHLFEALSYTDYNAFEREMVKAKMASARQISWIKIFNGGPIILGTNGLINPGSELLITVSGYWSWDSPAEWLPVDYEPPKDDRLN